ncbi:hypothetical protein C8Q70DRAFT_1037566 [Cubamyces menziesii]|nr:hypothetical protein C8Q70DRAFT_1037566 [Cubamyces menziesii]
MLTRTRTEVALASTAIVCGTHTTPLKPNHPTLSFQQTITSPPRAERPPKGQTAQRASARAAA